MTPKYERAAAAYLERCANTHVLKYLGGIIDRTLVQFPQLDAAAVADTLCRAICDEAKLRSALNDHSAALKAYSTSIERRTRR